MEKGSGRFLAKLIIGLFIITIVLLCFGFILFGFMGVVKVGTYFELVKINDNPSLFYFGWLLFLIYIILLSIEMCVRIAIKLGNIKQSVPKTIGFYILQVVAGTVTVKLLLDHVFEKIEVSLLVLSVSVAIFYVIIFFSSKAHMGKDDIWDDEV